MNDNGIYFDRSKKMCEKHIVRAAGCSLQDVGECDCRRNTKLVQFAKLVAIADASNGLALVASQLVSTYQRIAI